MASFFIDNVLTKSFTPKEFQVELLDSAKGKNIIVCLKPGTDKTFIVLKLIQELSHDLRKGGKRTLYLGNKENVVYYVEVLKNLTDLNIGKYLDTTDELDLSNQVLVTTYETCSTWLSKNIISWEWINLLILENCHNVIRDHPLRKVMLTLQDSKTIPKVLGLTSPLFSNPNVEPGSVEAQVKHLECDLRSEVDTASDIVSILRYNAHPVEQVVVCENASTTDLTLTLESEILKAKQFLDEHQYNPFDIYDDSFIEELSQIPDPKIQPYAIIEEFLEVLYSLGPWCADKAAEYLMDQIEKLKIKTPYERHFLLLCMLTTELVKIRSKCESAFQGITEKEIIDKYTTPKIHRLIEVIREFRPKNSKNQDVTPEVTNGNESIEKTETNDLNGNGKKLKDWENILSTLTEPKDTTRPSSRKLLGRGWRHRRNINLKNMRHHNSDDTDSLCGIIFVKKRITARIIYCLLSELHKTDPEFINILPQFTVDKVANSTTIQSEADSEHRKQEEVLRRFRMRDCNLLVATSVLEDGIELPRCNLVVRFDSMSDFKSHAHCKARARQQISHYVLIVENSLLKDFLSLYANHMLTEKTLLGHSLNIEPTEEEELEADCYTHLIPFYKPNSELDIKVDLSNAIAVVNKYCAKLPSDTFTRLVPLWGTFSIDYENQKMFYTSVRLPINSPIKEDIIGHPMHNKVLARRMAALRTCFVLHTRGELDNKFEPIGKEDTDFGEEENNVLPSNWWELDHPRPGTTKSRQYYYKKIASCLNKCQPTPGVPCSLYNLDMILTCPLPEEQNTRGRKLHPPETAPQAFGILTSKPIPKICPFPIFTRSGEVRVKLTLASKNVILDKRNIETISEFVYFTFTGTLRLQKLMMTFNPKNTKNSFFIVPTKKNEQGISEVDWDFLELVYKRRNEEPTILEEKDRENFVFDAEIYRDAVVTPWYRSRDSPQYFYVAEIYSHLTPKAKFPGCEYDSFEDYYNKKYKIQIQNRGQPLLDVDHTSARLNFLTPRYVNRKGVALPTSSEETKKAKRENLEQKQILIPELCHVHVIPASLWRQAVCLPCILYRINGLLLADEIRARVAEEIALGATELPENFEWSPLDFGWSLADVLQKSKEKCEIQNEVDTSLIIENALVPIEPKLDLIDENNVENASDSGNGTENTDWMEIGTWSNDMAQGQDDDESAITPIRYGSPNWSDGEWKDEQNRLWLDDFSDYDDEVSETSDGGSSRNSPGLKIKFENDYLAEAVYDPKKKDEVPCKEDPNDIWTWEANNFIPELKEEIQYEIESFHQSSKSFIEEIKQKGMLIKSGEPFVVKKELNKSTKFEKVQQLDYKVEDYGMKIIKNENCNKNEQVISESYDFDYDKLEFSFDYQPNLDGHPGPSPSILLQALTMSNANDGINLERLETIGDSFLKYAITTYLYCTHEYIHEGKLSHYRSKQVSNLKLFLLGQKKILGESMIASKFEPHDNWLPPCYDVWKDTSEEDSDDSLPLPYNLLTQHSIPDKSIADCAEALIGAYLIECGPRGALIFMSWLGIVVLPEEKIENTQKRHVGSFSRGVDNLTQYRYGELKAPKSPLLRHIENPESELIRLMEGFDCLERKLNYNFKDKAYLLQAMSHASYSPNRLTDCYQRLEFLGDAVLDYLITRHLYEDKRAHSPGSLTDLRSALVNNTIFASLAVKHGLHKYFRHLSPGLNDVVQRFVLIQEQNQHAICEEYYLVGDDVEDVEVPKALGDVFESIAGAIFLDSNMSLDVVWRVYYRMMKNEIEQFSRKVPKSPIRELLELEPETAKFSKPEKLADGRRVRVTVEVFGKGMFKGIGRNYRIAKCTAAKCALKQLKKKEMLARKVIN